VRAHRDLSSHRQQSARRPRAGALPHGQACQSTCPGAEEDTEAEQKKREEKVVETTEQMVLQADERLPLSKQVNSHTRRRVREQKTMAADEKGLRVFDPHRLCPCRVWPGLGILASKPAPERSVHQGIPLPRAHRTLTTTTRNSSPMNHCVSLSLSIRFIHVAGDTSNSRLRNRREREVGAGGKRKKEHITGTLPETSSASLERARRACMALDRHSEQ
jgi:hypothetical protein